MRKEKNVSYLYICLAAVLTLQILLSLGLRPERAKWGNVPNAPSELAYRASFLSDTALAHRMVATLLQNFGGSGGRTIALKEYNLEHIGEWLKLGHKLEPRSDYLPFLAAYYFSATQEPEQLEPIVDFLAEAGRGEGKEDWRWLSNAVYIARFELKDMDLAVKLADELAAMYQPGMPALIVQMPAFIQLQMGKKEASYNIMIELLKTSSDDMHPNEVNFMVDYICNRLLEGEARRKHPLCQGETE